MGGGGDSEATKSVKDVSTTFMLHQFPSHKWTIQNLDLFLQSAASKVTQPIGPLDPYRLQFSFELSKAFGGRRLKLGVVNGQQLAKPNESVHTSYLKIKLGLSSDAEWKEEFALDARSPKSHRFKLPKGAMKSGRVGSMFVVYAHEMVVSNTRPTTPEEQSAAKLLQKAEPKPVDTMPTNIAAKQQHDSNLNQQFSAKSEREKLLNSKSSTLPPKIPQQSVDAETIDSSKSTQLAASDDEDERKADERRLNRQMARSKLDSERGSDWSLVNEKEDGGAEIH